MHLQRLSFLLSHLPRNLDAQGVARFLEAHGVAPRVARDIAIVLAILTDDQLDAGDAELDADDDQSDVGAP